MSRLRGALEAADVARAAAALPGRAAAAAAPHAAWPRDAGAYSGAFAGGGDGGGAGAADSAFDALIADVRAAVEARSGAARQDAERGGGEGTPATPPRA